jgi:hypothetical protein
MVALERMLWLSGNKLLARRARQLRSNNGRELSAKRKSIPEPVFGQSREGRSLRRFLMRGLKKLNGQRTLSSSTHNILK